MSWVGGLPPAPITPSGSSVVGGVEYYADGISNAYTDDFTPTEVYLSLDGLSEAQTDAVINIDGYGLRSGYSENSTESTLDIGRGLTIINESGIISTDTNVLRFYGDTLYSGATLNKRSDATVTSDQGIEIDGGDSPNRTYAETIEGGDSVNDNVELNGGNA